MTKYKNTEIEITKVPMKKTKTKHVIKSNAKRAFTPARLVSAIVTEAGLIREPDQVKVEAVLRAAGASLTGS